MTLAMWGVALTACADSSSEPALTLDGPPEVRVEHLGPVPSPRVLLEDGTEAREIVWTVKDAAVARVQDDAVVAIAAGTTEITGALGDDHVGYRLTVDPAVVLRFAAPPSSARVGETLDIALEDPVAGLAWTSSDPAIATVQAGRVTGIGPGLVYITARKGTSEAMLQLEVRTPAP